MEIFSARLKWLRERKGLTQTEVSKYLGMSQSGYTKIEQGQREPKLEVLAQLPGIVGESTDFMLGVTDFTFNAFIIKSKFESSSGYLNKLKMDLLEVKFNPENPNISTRDFDPSDPVSVEAKITNLNKAIILYQNQMEQSREKLLNILDEIPLVKTSTTEEINNGDPWGDLLFSDDNE